MLKKLVATPVIALAMLVGSAQADIVEVHFDIDVESLRTDADIFQALKKFEATARTACLFDNPIARKQQIDRECFTELMSKAQNEIVKEAAIENAVLAQATLIEQR